MVRGLAALASLSFFLVASCGGDCVDFSDTFDLKLVVDLTFRAK